MVYQVQRTNIDGSGEAIYCESIAIAESIKTVQSERHPSSHVHIKQIGSPTEDQKYQARQTEANWQV